jgi:ribulose-phosphate 3-epimerase
MSLITPAVLPSSHADLDEKLALFAQMPSVNRIQIDVVDGKFASPASWPYTAPKEMREKVARSEMLPHLDHIEYEMDLMCLDAERAAGDWIALGASRITLHVESAFDLQKSVDALCTHYGCGLAECGLVSLGLAVHIASDLSLLEPHVGRIDYVQFMGIAKIGRQGQPFDRRVIEKVRAFHTRHPQIPVQVDGGVSLANARELIAAGVSNLVVGSGILRATDPAAALAKFEALESPYGV